MTMNTTKEATMANRLNTIIDLDSAITIIEKVRNQLQDMACPQYMDDQVQNLLNQLDGLRYQVLNEDLEG